MKFISAIVAVFMIIAVTGCEKDKNDEAPELPPATSMIIDMDDFSQTKTSGSYEHIGLAIGHVLYWNTMLKIGFAVPVASYQEAFNQEAERIDNDSWQWTYNVDVFDVTYTAVLTADVTGEIVDWAMVVSQEDGFQDFVWYTGSSNVTATSGTWTLYQNPSEPAEQIVITWNHDYENETFDIQYLNVSDDAYAGSLIFYEKTEDPIFNAHYELYNSQAGTSVEINLNTETHVGNIIVDDVPYCWDEDYLDTECVV